MNPFWISFLSGSEYTICTPVEITLHFDYNTLLHERSSSCNLYPLPEPHVSQSGRYHLTSLLRNRCLNAVDRFDREYIQNETREWNKTVNDFQNFSLGFFSKHFERQRQDDDVSNWARHWILGYVETNFLFHCLGTFQDEINDALIFVGERVCNRNPYGQIVGYIGIANSPPQSSQQYRDRKSHQMHKVN